MRKLTWLALLVMLSLSTLSFADTLYTYQSKGLNDTVSGETLYLTLTLDFAAPLSEGVNLNIVPSAWSAYALFQGDVWASLSSSTPRAWIQIPEFDIDGAGNLYGWYMTASSPSVTVQTDDTQYQVQDSIQQTSSAFAFTNRGTPGVWTVTSSGGPTPTPEPSSLALLGPGLVGVLGLIRRKLVQ